MSKRVLPPFPSPARKFAFSPHFLRASKHQKTFQGAWNWNLGQKWVKHKYIYQSNDPFQNFFDNHVFGRMLLISIFCGAEKNEIMLDELEVPNTFIEFFENARESLGLTLSWWRPISYRNQSIDLPCKSMDWFLYDIGLRHERVKNRKRILKVGWTDPVEPELKTWN